MTDTPDGDDAADVRLPTDESLFLQRARAVLEEAPVDAGPYRVIERIGGGGMGEVYKAQEGELGRLVALKLIRTGHDSAALSERFQVERRLLAEVDHPHVARVFGGGTTEDGRLYLAMEFVDGLPITEFADAQRLTIPQRLHLFRQVCEAIAYVHSKGIIHRDVKPANVLAYLFDGKPFAKVIDFGVAQAPARSFAAGVTVLGLPVGTIGYMSPEQASGKGRVDTRSDVYGLGALLYELLTGVPPFDVERLANAAIGEVLTLIQTNDPPRPSTRLSELDTVAAKESGLTIEPGVAPTARIAAARRTGARELRHTLSRELELIPLHAMRREPERRYATVVELAADVDRYLSGDALLAGPETRTYRSRKFALRHWKLISTIALIMLFLIAGATATTVVAHRATRAEAEAERRRDQAQVLVSFLTDDVLGRARPERLHDRAARDILLQQLIRPAVDSLEQKFSGDAMALGHVELTLSVLFRELGERKDALTMARRARDHFIAGGGANSPETLSARSAEAEMLYWLGRYPEAEALERTVVDDRRKLLGTNHLDTLGAMTLLAEVLNALGKNAEALNLASDALAGRQRLLGDDDGDTLGAELLKSEILTSLGRRTEALELAERCLTGRTRVFGLDDPNTIGVMSQVAEILRRSNRLEEARPIAEEALSRRRRTLGDDHPDTIGSMTQCAIIDWQAGQKAQAATILRDALRRSVENPNLGPTHPTTLQRASALAKCLEEMGLAGEASAVRKTFPTTQPS